MVTVQWSREVANRSILIAMITFGVSAIFVSISQVIVLGGWVRGDAMDPYLSIAAFPAVLSLIAIHVYLVFDMLPVSEARNLVGRMLEHVICKGAFLPLVVPPTLYQARVWSAWLLIMFTLKIYQGVARHRLEKAKARTSATFWYYLLLLNVVMNAYWMSVQSVYQTLEQSPVYLLLFFEPLSIAFETLQAILVHGFQLLDIHYSPLSPGITTNSKTSKLLIMAVGLLLGWKRVILRDVGFFLDIMTLLMSLGHYVYIWQLHGMTFHLVDAMLLLPILNLLTAVVKRTWMFINELRMGDGTLHAALLDTE